MGSFAALYGKLTKTKSETKGETTAAMPTLKQQHGSSARDGGVGVAGSSSANSANAGNQAVTNMHTNGNNPSHRHHGHSHKGSIHQPVSRLQRNLMIFSSSLSVIVGVVWLVLLRYGKLGSVFG